MPTTIDDPSLPLQDSVINALTAASTAAADRVYDRVPPSATYPYIRIGNCQVVAEHAECLQGAEVFLTIDAFSRSVGKVEVKQIGRAIIAALDDVDISTADVTVKSCLLQDVNYLDDPDGLTSHGVFTFHILTD